MNDMNDGNFAGGMATGYIIGSATEHDSERAGQRLLKNMGEDQILLKVAKPKDEVGTRLGELYSNWYYNFGRIYQHHGFPFDLEIAFFATFAIGFVLFLINFGYEILTNTFKSIISFGTGLTISIIIGTICGYLAGSSDDIIDYIKIGTVGKYTTILIKKYDSYGNRNMDEDEIALIIALLEK